MAHQLEYKTSGTTLPLYEVDFTEELPADTSLNASTSTVTATNSAGTDVTSTLIANKTVSGMVLKADILAGTNGEDYKVVFKGVGTTSAKPSEKVIEVRVRDTVIGSV